MKNTITAILLCITTLTLAQEEVNVTIAGKITNPNSDTLIIEDGWGDLFQLITLDKNGGQFYEDYQVTGIPRYILIDPLGKIVNSDAKRPSDKRLVAELESLVK